MAKKLKFTRSNIFKFESITIKDEEMDRGALSENKVHLATLGFFILYQGLLVLSHLLFAEYTLNQFVFLSVVALLLARQTALDFAYHILLEIYNVPIIIAAIFVPALMFDSGSITQSLIAGFGTFMFFLSFTLISSFIAKKSAGIGGGDIIFSFGLGGFLQGFLIFVSIFLSSVLSLIISVFYNDKKNIPMGPGLLLSFWICLIFNQQIMEQVSNFLR